MDANDLVNQLASELRVLRKSRGIDVQQIGERTGSTLRLACGIEDNDGPAAVRRKLRTRLSELADALPDDLKILAQAAFALVPEANQPFYGDRLQWAARKVNRLERTLRRRADIAVDQLAQLAAADLSLTPEQPSPATSGDGWHTDLLRAMLNLTAPQPEAFEFRTIVADRDELHEIDLAVTLTAAPNGSSSPAGGLTMDVLYGGRLRRRSMDTNRRFVMTLTFPHPLNNGDRHEFGLRFRVPENEPVRPHFVSITKQPCRKVELRVKFDEKNVPKNVWLLTRVFQNDVGSPGRRGEPVAVDPSAELQVRFVAPDPGFAYGVQWDAGQDDDALVG
ncbi:MAG TPA: hypothetical protein VHX38_21545 [Pseudonocardiaceae bacterium]|jgi:hypothetical protein|nr:hypothetical protein [Pseudonocardiaceae bacterium]